MTLPSYNSEPTNLHLCILLQRYVSKGRNFIGLLGDMLMPVVSRAGGGMISDELFYQNRMFGSKFSQRDTGYMAAVDVHDIVSPGSPFAHICIHRGSLILLSNSSQSYHLLKCTPSWKSQLAVAPRSKVCGPLFSECWISSCTSYRWHVLSQLMLALTSSCQSGQLFACGFSLPIVDLSDHSCIRQKVPERSRKLSFLREHVSFSLSLIFGQKIKCYSLFGVDPYVCPSLLGRLRNKFVIIKVLPTGIFQILDYPLRLPLSKALILQKSMIYCAQLPVNKVISFFLVN